MDLSPICELRFLLQVRRHHQFLHIGQPRKAKCVSKPRLAKVLHLSVRSAAEQRQDPSGWYEAERGSLGTRTSSFSLKTSDRSRKDWGNTPEHPRNALTRAVYHRTGQAGLRSDR